jgi:hypothetical protein
MPRRSGVPGKRKGKKRKEKKRKEEERKPIFLLCVSVIPYNFDFNK